MTGEETTVDWVQCPSISPSSIESCNTGPCEEVYEWKPQEWSQVKLQILWIGGLKMSENSICQKVNVTRSFEIDALMITFLLELFLSFLSSCNNLLITA